MMTRFVFGAVFALVMATESVSGQEYWGALALGQSVPSTDSVIYPYDGYGVAWNFSNSQSAIDAALKACKSRSFYNCGRGMFAFSSSAISGDHLVAKCITVWIWPNPGLSGLEVAEWTSGTELPEYFRGKRLSAHKVYCNAG